MSVAIETSQLAIKAGPQLFLDDYFIESIDGLDRVTCQPHKHDEPVLKNDQQHSFFQPFFSVTAPQVDIDSPLCIPGQDRLRLWYSCRITPTDANSPKYDHLIQHAYAESVDGVHWVQPALGLVNIPNWPNNNLLPTPQHGGTGYPLSVIDNGPDYTPADRRYMMMTYKGIIEKEGAWALFSADGLNWTSPKENPVVPHQWSYGKPWQKGEEEVYVDGLSVYYDAPRQRYIMMHVITPHPDEGYIGRSRTGPIRRMIAQMESDDFIHWSAPRVILGPDDQRDMTEYYSMNVLHRNGLYLGFPRILRDDMAADHNSPVEGIGWTELAISRDGENWTRLPGAFLDRDHRTNTWDHAMAWLNAPVDTDREMFFFYTGYSQGHKVGKRQIGLARSPRDRFVALETQSHQSGMLRSKTFTTDCSTLTINAAINQSIRVQLYDDRNHVIEGYSFENCKPVVGDTIRHAIQWKEHQSLPSAAKDRGITIEIALNNASLYAVNLED